MILFRVVLFSVFCFLGLSSFAASEGDLIPPVTHIGEVTAEEQRWGQELRQALQANLLYWQRLGLPESEGIEGIYSFSYRQDTPLITVLQILNPDIPDIKQHVHAQYELLKNSQLRVGVYGIVKAFRALVDSTDQDDEVRTLNWLFDLFARTRYGFQAKNFYRAVMSNMTLAEISRGESAMPQSDNAYYGRFPRINLKTLLTPAAPPDSAEKPNNDWIDGEVLQNLVQNPGGTSRRIVLLPRTRQRAGDHDVSTLRDLSVASHEQGHHFVAVLAGKGRVSTLVNEVLADFFAAAPSGNPRIGEFFARASGVVAERVRQELDVNSKDLRRAHALSQLGEKMLLRDLSQASDIDDLNRVHSIQDAYGAGNPLRHFLWTLHQAHGEEVDRLTLQVVPEFASLPQVVPSKVMMKHIMRTIWLGMRKERAIKRFAKKKLAPLTSAEEKRFFEQANAEAVKWYEETYPREDVDFNDPEAQKQILERARVIIAHAEKKGITMRRASLADAAMKIARDQYGKEFYETRKKALAEKRDKILADLKTKTGLRDDGMIPAIVLEKMWDEKFGREEKRLKRERRFWGQVGLGLRPSIPADFEIPEFLRAYYRVAAQQAPHLLADIRKAAEVAMHSSSVVIQTRAGTQEIVFVRNFVHKLSYPFLISRANDLAELRLQIAQLKEEQNDVARARRKDLENTYDRLLEGLVEYERTGMILDLKYPNLAGRTALKAGKAALNFLSKRAERSKARADEKACRDVLEKKN